MHDGPSGSKPRSIPRFNETSSAIEEDDQVKLAFENLSNHTRELKNGTPKITRNLDAITRDNVQETILKVKKVYKGGGPAAKRVERYLMRLISRTICLSDSITIQPSSPTIRRALMGFDRFPHLGKKHVTTYIFTAS